MKVLKGLKPESVFRYFEEICSIPHGSRHTEKISAYLEAFARARNLPCIRDDKGNVIITAKGTCGKENQPVVILQGHMDMVCEKTADCHINFLEDGLDLQVDQGRITAKGTTLGGDDGVAVAYILAILDDDHISHPPLEAVITVDEEIGMLGAQALDMSLLQGRTMLNIDSEDEGILVASCAGGATARIHIPLNREPVFSDQEISDLWELSLTGLKGGHSGVEIDKNRANASRVLGRVLEALYKAKPFRLISLEGGEKDNAIPRSARAILKFDQEVLMESGHSPKTVVSEFQTVLSGEFKTTDPGIQVNFQQVKEEDVSAGLSQGLISLEETKNLLSLLRVLPDGIQRMSPDMEGLVQTSLNLGIMTTGKEGADFTCSVRSSVESEKRELIDRLEILASMAGGEFDLSGDYPGWEYRAQSPLRDLMIEVFRDQYGREPEVQAIHAGLECGFFAGRMPGLDCIAFGPDISDIHTPDEALDIASVERTWNYILEILARL